MLFLKPGWTKRIRTYSDWFTPLPFEVEECCQDQWRDSVTSHLAEHWPNLTPFALWVGVWIWSLVIWAQTRWDWVYYVWTSHYPWELCGQDWGYYD
jgi:hypothetical protein